MVARQAKSVFKGLIKSGYAVYETARETMAELKEVGEDIVAEAVSEIQSEKMAAAIIACGSAATSIGLFLPWLLSRFDVDPAFGSGPVCTIIQDVLSLLTYFAVVWLLI